MAITLTNYLESKDELLAKYVGINLSDFSLVSPVLNENGLDVLYNRFYTGSRYAWGVTQYAGTGVYYTTAPLNAAAWSTVPVLISDSIISSPTFRKIVQTGAGGGGITTSGLLYMWGFNFYGVIGSGGAGGFTSWPQQTQGTGWKDVARDGSSAIGIQTDGSLWAWGSNQSGQLGLNSTSNQATITTPRRVGLDTNWRSVWTGADSSFFAIKTDGSLWGWGANGGTGQLGLNDTASRSSPTQIGTEYNWKSISTDVEAVCVHALKTDGTLWAWGTNTAGRLGLNDTLNRSSPVQVGTDTNWRQVLGGRAIKTDNTLWAWGVNTFGQLGLGDKIHRSTPVQVGALKRWNYVVPGPNVTFALGTDGSLWSWGYADQYGVLGQGTTSLHVSSPVQIGNLSNWRRVASGPTYGGSPVALALR